MNETLMNFQKKTKVLSREETVKLFKKARNGNKDAREKLICSNLGMVMKAAKELNIDMKYEVQKENVIINELSNEEIKSSDAILFVTQKEIEQIIDVERFIHMDYYQVVPVFIMQDAKSILIEVRDDLKQQ